MKLRNKKTGEVIEWDKNLTYKLDREYTSLKELCENYEDYEAPKLEKWEPKEGDEYFRIDEYGILKYDVWHGHTYEYELLKIGNVFRTKKDAEKARTWLKIRKVLFDDTKGFKPDWGSREEKAWGVYYVTTYGRLETAYIEAVMVEYPGPYFATKEDAEASIMAHEEEWKIYLGVKE